MSIFETHSHYHFFTDKPEESVLDLLQEARNAGVTHALLVGTQAVDDELFQFHTQYSDLSRFNQIPQLFCSAGIHPEQVTEYIAEHPEAIPEILAATNAGEYVSQQISTFNTAIKDKPIIVLGECGLDYSKLRDKGDKRAAVIKAQKELFQNQLQLASQLALPVIIHARDKNNQVQAYQDILELITQFPNLRYILHCVSGPLEYVQAALKFDTYVGVAGNVTYDTAESIRILVKATPADRILLETDCPYLAPLPHPRSEKCRPSWIKDTGQFLEKNLELNLDQIYQNSLECFRIKS